MSFSQRRAFSVLTFLALLGFSLACGGMGGEGGGDPVPEPVFVEPSDMDGMYMEGELEGDGELAAFEDRMFAIYSASPYAYCDARLLAQLWGQDPWQGKVYIGQKIDLGLESDVLAGTLSEARAYARQDPDTRGCEFYETRYSYDDAERLAAVWGVSIDEAKTRVEQKVLWGDEAIIDSALQQGGAHVEEAPRTPAPATTTPSRPAKAGKTGGTGGKAGKGGKGGKGGKVKGKQGD